MSDQTWDRGPFAMEMGFRLLVDTPDFVEVLMPISEKVQQPFGFVHGGVTIALLETAASRAAELRADLERERPFGIEANIRHWKSGRSGSVRGVAEFDHEEGDTQFWNVTAYDDEGDVMSSGTFKTKIVSLERLAEKERKRAAAKAAAQAGGVEGNPAGKVE